MRKANIIFIVLLVLFFTSSLLFYNWYFESGDSKYFQPKSERIVAKHSSKAPMLVSLYNTEKDPHGKFISANQCLICHKMGAEINRNNLDAKIKTPQVNYKCQVALGNNNCMSCHQYGP